MGGAAITIALQQLKGFFGIQKFTKNTDPVSVMKSVFDSAFHGWNWQTTLMGSFFLAYLLFAKHIGKKKNLFWLPAIAPLISVVLSSLLVYVTHVDKHGLMIEAAAIGRTFAAMKDYQLDGNREMVALGTLNVISSMSSCYIATGSFCRSTINYMVGCTPVSNLVMSAVVFLALLLITPLLKYTLNAILSSIIISAVIGVIDYTAHLIRKS